MTIERKLLSTSPSGGATDVADVFSTDVYDGNGENAENCEKNSSPINGIGNGLCSSLKEEEGDVIAHRIEYAKKLK